MNALSSLNSNIQSLTLAVAAAIPDINPPVAGSGATEVQVQAAADAVAAQTALLNTAVAGGTKPGVPSAPTVLTATVTSPGNVALSFTASPGATGYLIKRGPGSGLEVTINPTPTPATTFTETLPVGTVAFYVVTALSAAGESLPSNEVSVTP